MEIKGIEGGKEKNEKKNKEQIMCRTWDCKNSQIVFSILTINVIF